MFWRHYNFSFATLAVTILMYTQDLLLWSLLNMKFPSKIVVSDSSFFSYIDICLSSKLYIIRYEKHHQI
jgi:hypothetical protein